MDFGEEKRGGNGFESCADEINGKLRLVLACNLRIVQFTVLQRHLGGKNGYVVT
jgi:hypothetical protein